jgi:hypothetical protein
VHGAARKLRFSFQTALRARATPTRSGRSRTWIPSWVSTRLRRTERTAGKAGVSLVSPRRSDPPAEALAKAGAEPGVVGGRGLRAAQRRLWCDASERCRARNHSSSRSHRRYTAVNARAQRTPRFPSEWGVNLLAEPHSVRATDRPWRYLASWRCVVAFSPLHAQEVRESRRCAARRRPPRYPPACRPLAALSADRRGLTRETPAAPAEILDLCLPSGGPFEALHPRINHRSALITPCG